jgi:integrase/recombinase XerD
MEALKKYPSFAKLQTALERGRLAPTTLETYVNAIINFAEALNLKDLENALEVIKGKEDKEEFLNDAVDTLRKGMSDTTVSNVFKAIRYWLRVNGVIVDWDSVIIPTGEAQVEDRIATKDEFNQLLTVANIRDKAVALVASSSGLRLNTLLTLKVGDVNLHLPEIASIMVKRVYTMDGKEYTTGRKISKKRKFFVTFATPEARRSLEAYLQWRKEEGEEITPESPLFTRHDKVGRGQFLEKHAFDVQWRKLLRRAHLNKKAEGSPWNVLHFHTLKKYAETKMIDSGVKKEYREFFLGHKGGYLESNYFRGEEAKCIEEYRKAIPNLSVSEVTSLKEIKERQEVVERLQDKVNRGEPFTPQDEEDRKRWGIRIMFTKEKVAGPDEKVEFEKEKKKDDCQRIVSEEELQNLLTQGWRVCAVLPSGRVVVSNE